MRNQWIAFVLTAVGAVAVGLWIYRKINPAPNSIASGGAGSQSTTPGGFRIDTPLSTIATDGPLSIRPAGSSVKPDWSNTYDVDFVNSLPGR